MSITRYVVTVAAAAALGTTSLGASPQGRYDRRGPDVLSGTYELDRGKSDDPTRIADRATRGLPPDRRDRTYENLLARLDAPPSLALDLRGRQVTIMSSNGPQVRFDADGRSRQEPGPNGRSMTTRATIDGDALVVATSGTRTADYTVRFDPVPDGLRVTRQLNSDALGAPVSSTAFYHRVADEPRWNVYDDRRPPVVIPDGTTITARIDRDFTSRTDPDGEPFSMTIVGPGPYRGAIITGIAGRTDTGSGRANLVFQFDTIRTPDGQSGPFAGDIVSVRRPDGSVVRVDGTGAVRDRRRGGGASVNDTAVGATLGAILGAVIGGGKGAAIGAIAGGAGTIALENGRDLTLPAGSEVTITAYGPGR